MIRAVPLFAAACSAVFALDAFGRAEAEPQPDPREVQAYLAKIDSDAAAAERARDHRKASAEKRIRNFVEGAATRAPSDALLNRIETAVAG